MYVLGPKHDPSTVLSRLSEDKEIDEEEMKNFKHIHTCEVSDLSCLMLILKIQLVVAAAIIFSDRLLCSFDDKD